MTAQHSLSGDASLSVARAGTHAGQTRRLTALTIDPLLIRALQDLSAGGIDTSVVSDINTFTDEMLHHPDAVALIDAEVLDTPVGEVVDLITRQLPHLCLMVAGHSGEQQQLASRIASQAVFRFVHKPASPQRLKLFLDAAARVADGIATATVPVIAGKTLPAHSGTAGGGRSPRVLALIGAVVAAVAVGIWALWPNHRSAGKSVDTAAGPATAIVRPDITALLSQAGQALAAGRFVASDGSSAAELYRAALKLDAANHAASDGYARAVDQALHGAEDSLLAGRLTEAGNIAAAVQLLEPGNSRLTFLNTQIVREQARVNTDASQRQAFEARQTQIRKALASMKERLQGGALLDPSASSAIAGFREAEAIGANDPAVQAARETLVAALLTAADTELGAHRQSEARRLVDAAGSINSSASGLDVMRRRVDEVLRPAIQEPPASAPPAPALPAPAPRAETPAPAAPTAAPAPAQAIAPAAPAPVTAPAPASATNEVISASKLKLQRSVEPAYPDWALQQLISGWVDMEFTVAKDGSVQDISVTGAEPRGTFDKAAVSALSRYRFAPVVKDGAVVVQRARIRMRFTAQDTK